MNKTIVKKAILGAYDVSPTKNNFKFLSQFANRNLNYFALIVNLSQLK